MLLCQPLRPCLLRFTDEKKTVQEVKENKVQGNSRVGSMQGLNIVKKPSLQLFYGQPIQHLETGVGADSRFRNQSCLDGSAFQLFLDFMTIPLGGGRFPRSGNIRSR